ncbi:Katanin p80 WD40 repeat-containing subunit B1 [Cryptotermes secundus]|uniref:Katanin p80 WD40 repeat-containing subunit B1 n=1 Tax=Cryptotermes secundus TaxID=105785 RepID=A0A2J7QW90_9NEOP|nr:katanin p80 WD40 repeat-containing subunit B1 isoform X2 [Cryptotermes secundus]PNF32849.1 Katanin p80 WD40 repeat-containing subunit B1 [Cryptotermes secundus]
MATSSKRSWKLQHFVAHGSNVNCLALGHKSGRVLVTGGDDKKVNLWAVGKHNCIMSLSGHSTPVECVKFGHTEELVCAGSHTGALKIWDLEAAKIVRTLTGHRAAIRCMDFHPYGDLLASGSLDTSIKMWDIRRKSWIFTYKGHRIAVNSLKFSPDGQWIASGGDDCLVKLWDIRAGRLFKEFSDHTGPVTAVEFHPNEFLLASGSCDHSVNFWDLENFQLVSTTDQDVGAIRCINFSQGGECLYAGSLDVLKVYGWEPARTHDTIPMGWGKIQDISTAQNQLIGASFQLTNVSLYAVDLKRVQPFGEEPYCPSSSPFVHGQRIRKSFNQDKPVNVSKAALNIKTTEEYERSGTDPEDESQSMADIQNMKVYEVVFQPSRIHPSLPQILQPPLSDPEGPVCTHSGNGVELMETSFHQLPAGVTVRTPPSPPTEPAVMNDEPSLQASTSPCAKRSNVRRLSITTDPSSFPEVDFPVKLSNMRYSPSEPALNQLDLSYARSLSLSRNLAALNPETFKSDCHVQNSTTAPAYSKPATAKTTVHKPVASPSLPVEISVSQARLKECSSSLGGDSDEKERDDFIPVMSDKSFDLDLEEFLPKNCLKTLGYQRTLPEDEEESMSTLRRGHDRMMKILTSRQRNLNITCSIWRNKERKAAIDSAVAMKDLSVIVDILGVMMLRQSVWNLDLCVAFLPAIYDLIQSKYEIYMTAGCNALMLILRNFAQVIKTNMKAPIQTIGVDIPREERYNKCIKCYNSLMTIRTFVLKRQTLPGELGKTFRDLHILLQSFN